MQLESHLEGLFHPLWAPFSPSHRPKKPTSDLSRGPHSILPDILTDIIMASKEWTNDDDFEIVQSHYPHNDNRHLTDSRSMTR